MDKAACIDIGRLRKLDCSVHIRMIEDNYKHIFLKEYMGIPVREPKGLSAIAKD